MGILQRKSQALIESDVELSLPWIVTQITFCMGCLGRRHRPSQWPVRLGEDCESSVFLRCISALCTAAIAVATPPHSLRLPPKPKLVE